MSTCFQDARGLGLLRRAEGWFSSVRKYRFRVYGERTVRRAETVKVETTVEIRIALEMRST